MKRTLKEDALGEFDLDPCAPMRPLWRTARVMYNKEQDGLKQKWEGRVWLNPPYSRPTIEHFITRMVEHNNGIALLFNRLDNKMFQDVVFPKAKRYIVHERKDKIPQRRWNNR